MNAPTFRDRLILWLWCLLAGLSTITLHLYLPMSTRVELEELSERPLWITIFSGFSTAATVGIAYSLRNTPVFRGELRRPMMIGSIAAVLGFSGYTTYTYAFSRSLAVAEEAPDIGELAPEFAITDPEGRLWTLTGLRGYDVLLVFYRGHW